MNIRLAVTSDVIKASRLWLRMTNEFEPEAVPNIEWHRERLLSLLDSGSYFLFIAEEGGALVGYVDFVMVKEPSDGKIHAIGQQLYVILEKRNTSVSGRLWKAAFKKAVALGAEIMDTTAYSSTKEFWERRGFVFYSYSLRKEV